MFRIIFNAAPVVEALRAAQDRLADMTQVHQDIGEYMIEATKGRFRARIAPDGSTWAPKSPTTIARYRRLGDGNLTKPLLGSSGRLSNEIVMAAGRSEVEIGSNLEYSGVMQTGAGKGQFGRTRRGGPIPWGNIPARVWLGLSDVDERNILDIVDEHLGDAIA